MNICIKLYKKIDNNYCNETDYFNQNSLIKLCKDTNMNKRLLWLIASNMLGENAIVDPSYW